MQRELFLCFTQLTAIYNPESTSSNVYHTTLEFERQCFHLTVLPPPSSKCCCSKLYPATGKKITAHYCLPCVYIHPRENHTCRSKDDPPASKRIPAVIPHPFLLFQFTFDRNPCPSGPMGPCFCFRSSYAGSPYAHSRGSSNPTSQCPQ